MNDLLTFLRRDAGGHLIRVHWFPDKVVFEVHPRGGINLREHVLGQGWIYHQSQSGYDGVMRGWEISPDMMIALADQHNPHTAIIFRPMREFEEVATEHLTPTA